jgi:hypothetical protein
MSFLVTVVRDKSAAPRSRRLVVLTHKMSRCLVNAYCSRAIGMAVLRAEPFELEVTPYTANGEGPEKVSTWWLIPSYSARWLGKPGGGRDELRLEYRLSGTRGAWERIG